MRQDKLEQKARRSPGSLTINDARRLAETNGFRWRAGRRGHVVLTHPSLVETAGVASPHPDKHVKSVYIEDLLKAIEQVRRLEAEQREQEGQP